MRSVLLGFMLAVFSGLSARAEPVRLVTGDDYPPFASRELTGGGMTTRLVNAVFEEAGYETTLDWRPWKRGYDGVISGEFDATFPYVETEERKAEMLYTRELVALEQVLVSSAAAPVDFDQPSDLAGLTLCQPIGWAIPEPLRPLAAEGRLALYEPPNAKTCPRHIASRRADIYFTDHFARVRNAREAGVDPRDFHVAGTLLDRQSLHLITAQASPRAAALIADFDAAFARFRQSGAYDALIAEYEQ